MKLKIDECHLLLFGTKHEYIWVKIVHDKTWESNKEEFLGVPVGNKLKFDNPIANVCLCVK